MTCNTMFRKAIRYSGKCPINPTLSGTFPKCNFGSQCNHILATNAIYSLSIRNFAQKNKKVKSPRSPEDIRKAQLAADPSGLLRKAIQTEEEFYSEQGKLDLTRLSRMDNENFNDDFDATDTIGKETKRKSKTKTMTDDKKMEKNAMTLRNSKETIVMIDGKEHALSPVSSSYAPTAITFGSRFDYHPQAHLRKSETLTLDRIFYKYQLPNGEKILIREGANARVNALIKDLTAREIIELLRKPTLYHLFPSDLLDYQYQQLIDMTKTNFVNKDRKKAKRIQYARRLLQHWWLQIKGKPPLKVESSTFI